MPRETRHRPAGSTASRPLASLLAHSTTPNELLPHLHQHALDVTGGSRSALLLPLVRRGDRVGMVAVGFDQPPSSADVGGDVIEVADAFMTAIELFHLRQADELQRDVRALLEEFTGSLSATLNLAAGLDIFCHGANRLFAADRTSVWIHDRRARHLVLQASSDPSDVARGVRVSTEDG